MYGCPGSLDELKQLVSVMQERALGNGFDPGPAAFASSRPVFEYNLSLLGVLQTATTLGRVRAIAPGGCARRRNRRR